MRASFFLDTNRVIEPGLEANYTPPALDDRLKVHKRAYHKDECTNLYGLPPGNHVLSIHTNHSYHHFTSLTHVITFL